MAQEMEQDSGVKLPEAAQEKLANLKEKIDETKEQIASSAENVLHRVGEKLSDTGAAIWEKTPDQGPLADPLVSAAANLEATGEYLANAEVTDIIGDVSAFINRYPWQSFCLGIGVGLLLGSALSRR